MQGRLIQVKIKMLLEFNGKYTNPKTKDVDIPHHHMMQIRTLNFNSNIITISSTGKVNLENTKTYMSKTHTSSHQQFQIKASNSQQ